MIHSQRVVALVPIKASSEPVGEKNFRTFCGKPLFHHIIHALDRTYAIDRILIDTDSDVVMRDAPELSHKVRIIKRPDEIRNGNVSIDRLIEYDLAQPGAEADIYLQTHATNPLLSSTTIAKALKKFVEDQTGCDSLFGVTERRMRFYGEDGKPINHDPRNLVHTLEIAPLYEDNSCIYVFTKASFADTGNRIGANPKMFPIPQIESTDIADEFSFRLAELLAMYSQMSAQV